ncbi:MAG: hypothetical protein JWL59_103 [Chthoniobacteraceae bacterium]|nr:hypothetical protein [Chthoniobacteraceae bacterium]
MTHSLFRKSQAAFGAFRSRATEPHRQPESVVIKLAVAALWILFFASTLIPLDAVWLSYGNSYSYHFFFDVHGIKWSYEGAIRSAIILFLPFVDLAVGVALALRFLPKEEFSHPFRQSHLALGLILGLGSLLFVTFEPGASGFFNFSDAWRIGAVSAVEELWFHGLLVQALRRRRVLGIVLSSVLLGVWHVCLIDRLGGVGLDTSRGLERALMLALVAVPFGIARYRGASIFSLITANAFLTFLLNGFADYPYGFGRHTTSQIAAICSAYLGVVVLLTALSTYRCGNRGALRLVILFAICSMLGALMARTTSKAHPGARPAERNAGWLDDLDFLASEYPESHLDFDRLMSESAFKAEINQIKLSVPTSGNAQIALQIRRVIAKLRVAHSYVIAHQQNVYPVRFDWLSDALVFTRVNDGASDSPSQTLRVAGFGATTPDKVEEMISPYLSCENRFWLHQCIPNALNWPGLLQMLKLTNEDRSLPLRCMDDNGAIQEIVIAPSQASAMAESLLSSSRPPLISPMPADQLKHAQNYWGGILQEYPNTLYIRYDSCMDRADNPFGSFAQFAHAMLRLADERAASQIIIDLRFNAGGKIDLIAPLMRGLKQRSPIFSSGRIRVLIGNGSNSATVINALALKEELGAVLMGEPTGGELAFYSAPKPLTLPNTQIQIFYPTQKISAHYGAHGPLMPDLSVARPSFDDFLHGRDPLIDAAAKLSRR